MLWRPVQCFACLLRSRAVQSTKSRCLSAHPNRPALLRSAPEIRWKYLLERLRNKNNAPRIYEIVVSTYKLDCRTSVSIQKHLRGLVEIRDAPVERFCIKIGITIWTGKLCHPYRVIWVEVADVLGPFSKSSNRSIVMQGYEVC